VGGLPSLPLGFHRHCGEVVSRLLLPPTSSFCSADPRLTGTSSLALQFGCGHGEVMLVHPRSPNLRPSSRVASAVSIGPLNRSSWVAGGRRGGSVPVGAASEHGEVFRDFPVVKMNYVRVLYAYWQTRGIVWLEFTN
jgi:hypothetical protein